MATFEDLQKANATITTTDIKGKDYAEVHQRIKAFRMVYPEGFIRTELVRLQDGMCLMRAECGIGDNVLGTGTAYELENSSFINRTSYIENTETSAVGRCLGMAGFGIDTSICSADELSNALENQEAIKPVTKTQIKTLTALADMKGSKIEDICKYFGVSSLDEMTRKQYSVCLEKLNDKKVAE